MPLPIGQILQGRYTIVKTLGQGGMGAVYLAEDGRLPGRRCAIKENLPDPNASPQALAQLRQQFQREAAVLASLDHPNLPKVSDYFSEAGPEYLVMDYVEGEDLDSALQRTGRPLPEKPVLIWTEQVLDALEYLHSQHPQPIIHRDIKPANIRLTLQGKVKLVDFGLVKLLDPSDPRTKTVLRGLGTPEYTPLEQYASGASHTDARSDLYSLGTTLYHLLTNVAPPDVHQRLLNPGVLMPPRQLNPQLSENTERMVLRAMEIHPDQRYQSAAEMRQALLTPTGPKVGTQRRAITRPTARWRRWLTLVLSIFALSIAAVAAWFLLPPRYDSATGDIFWADDRLLWARDSLLVSVSASASGPAHLVVKGRGGAIQTVGQDGRGQLWVGLAGDGLDYQQGDEWTRYVFEGGTQANTVQAIVSDRSKGVWIGTREGAVHFDGEGWSFYTSDDGLSGNDVRAITVAHDDAVWFGTWGDGLTSWREDRVVTYRFGDNEKWNRITALQTLGEDLWVGTQAGLVQFRPGGQEMYYTQADGLAGDFVTDLATDPDGRLWVGTWGGGVSTFDESRIASTVFKPKKSNYVVDLAVGGNKVWVMSPMGIMVFDLETEIWTPY